MAAASVLAALLAGLVTAPAHAAGEQNCDSKPTGRHLWPTTTLRAWHNSNIAKITDSEVCFEGYVSNFSGKSDIDGDGDRDRLRASPSYAELFELYKNAKTDDEKAVLKDAMNRLIPKATP